MKPAILSIILSGMVAGCQTVSPPSELHSAREAVSAAEDADVDDVMPRTMELATRQLEEAEELWERSLDAAEDNDLQRSSELTSASIQAASTAKEAADTGVRVTQNLDTWDGQPALYAQMESRANEAESLAQQLNENQVGAAADRQEPQIIGELVLEAVPIAYFDTDKTEPLQENERSIQQVADFLKNHPEATVELVGYADPRGDASRNQKLAEQRAKSVGNLLAQHGVDKSKFRVRGAGEAEGSDQQSLAKLQLDRKVTVKMDHQVAH